MIIKLECINEDAAQWIAKNWPDETISQGKAVICLNIPADELGYIQQQARAHTVELTEQDNSLICDRTVQLMAQD
ncbi:hypothetical protein [Endozoicomonas sp. GU-1]|uniref:hypothetical protein n=1 Tax=Endozoicomonas sp. GU-1 TaxID=3009078 RepID=UPI0022B2DE7D|nr:hypothetical protein [Endozoicomonas sp. GU-1]WBA79566.1 hypothetical protein O2T12_14375 [Endozoicomonas sp. GU-1]